ncbi:MAG TPA: glycosyltransferase family 9 protein [Rhodanobacteraceae bacterium]|nr:glycosyltransferase family 9 protein [Rhodanobacteraceae bacterium]
MSSLERMVKRGRYSELRRRVTRRAMQPLFRTGDARLTSAADLSGADIRRILICRPNHRLGNLLLLTPLVTEIQRLFPKADIDIVLAGEHVAELFQEFPNIRRIHNLSRRMVRHPIELARIAMQIRWARYDLAIDPCEASQSSRLLVAVANPRFAIGAPRSRSPVGPALTWMEQAPVHMAQWPVHLLRGVMNPQSPALEFPNLDIRLSEEERQHARAQLEQAINVKDGSRALRIIGIFAAATGAKACGKEWWQSFLDVVRTRHPDAAIVEIVPADGQPHLGLPSFGSLSPRKVAAVIANMTCFVSADCGVMHLASAAGVPTIGLFKASDSLKYAPYGHGSQAFDINGKSPEDVAEWASMLIEMLPAEPVAGPPGQPTR